MNKECAAHMLVSAPKRVWRAKSMENMSSNDRPLLVTDRTWQKPGILMYFVSLPTYSLDAFSLQKHLLQHSPLMRPGSQWFEANKAPGPMIVGYGCHGLYQQALRGFLSPDQSDSPWDVSSLNEIEW